MRCSVYKIVLLLYILKFASGFSHMPHVRNTVVLRGSRPFVSSELRTYVPWQQPRQRCSQPSGLRRKRAGSSWSGRPVNSGFGVLQSIWRETGMCATMTILLSAGVGAKIGGFAGDGLPVARVMSSMVDTLITHPNVVNGAMLLAHVQHALHRGLCARYFRARADRAAASDDRGEASAGGPQGGDAEFDDDDSSVERDTQTCHSSAPTQQPLLLRLKLLLRNALLSAYWEAFMSASILLYSVGMGSFDMYAKLKKTKWKAAVDEVSLWYSFVICLFEALLKMLALGVGLRSKQKVSGEIKLIKLTVQEARQVDETFNLLDRKGMGTLNLQEFRAVLRELGRNKGLYLLENDVQELYDMVDSDSGIEVAEVRYLVRKAFATIPEPLPYFQNGWHKFDFFTILVQFAALLSVSSGGNLSFWDNKRASKFMIMGRMLRLLSLGRVLWGFASIRDWLTVIVRSVLLIVFIIAVYGELGVYLFGLDGHMYGKCVVSLENPYASYGLNSSSPSSSYSRNSTAGELLQPLRVCNKRDGVIASSYECEKGYSVCACRMKDTGADYRKNVKLSDADISGTVGDKLQQGAGQEYASAVALKNAEFARAQPGCQRVLSGYVHNAQRPKGESLPGLGYMGLSDMGTGMLTVWIVMTESNFSDLLGYLTYANDRVTAWLFLVSLVVFSRFIAVGLPIAIVSTIWIDISRERLLRQEKKEQDAHDDALLAHLKKDQAQKNESTDLQTAAPESTNKGEKERQVRAKALRQAILRRLGGRDASALRAEIVAVFNLFDTDSSGEVGLAQLVAAFRRLGVDLTVREAEALIAEDEDGNGIVDLDELVQMVQKMLGANDGMVDLQASGDFGDTYVYNIYNICNIQMVHTYIHAYMQASGDSETRVCMCVYRPSYIQTYVRIYIRTYIHTYIRIYRHTYTRVFTWLKTYIYRSQSGGGKVLCSSTLHVQNIFVIMSRVSAFPIRYATN